MTQPTPLRYGIIGCGMMGQEHIRSLALVPGAQVAALFDPDAGMRAAALALAPDAMAADSLDDLLAAKLDALVIASPNHLHLLQLEQALRTAPRPILLEKPVFTDAADLARLQRLAPQAGAVWVGMEYRYMPAIAQLIAQADAVTGGVQMLTIREYRLPFLHKVGDWNRFVRQTGGTFVEKCCHFFDLMRLILRDDPVRVMASGGQAVNHLDQRIGGRTPDMRDHGYVIVEFRRGTRAMLELCMFAEGSDWQEDVTAIGPLGQIRARLPGPPRFWPADAGPQPAPELQVMTRVPGQGRRLSLPVDPALAAAGDHHGATALQHRAFAQAMRAGQPPQVSFTDGWWATAIGLAAELSADTGQAVDLPAQAWLPPYENA